MLHGTSTYVFFFINYNAVYMHYQDQSLEQASTMAVPVVMSFLSPLHLNFPLSLDVKTMLRVSCKFK